MNGLWLFIGTLAVGGAWLLIGPMLLHLGNRQLTRTAGRIAGLPEDEIEHQVSLLDGR